MLGARNYALILTYLMTGYRNVEVVSMRWGSIKAHSHLPGSWLFDWAGKGGRSQVDPLPDRVYGAIVHYLKIAGRRLEEMQPEEYIFTPLVTHNMANLKNYKEDAALGHLSTNQAERILKTALRQAGVAHVTALVFARTPSD